jgi:N-formylglutamate amidohydrolase
MVLVTYSETRLVKRHRGTMPIILTCPHDGTETPPNVTERTETNNPDECGELKTLRDTNTADVTERVAQRILESSGLSPYVVIARFRRRFIDANRERGCAYVQDDQADEAAAFYDAYHQTIEGFVRELLTENAGRGFLFDIHGTRVISGDPADLYLGTDNGGSLSRGFSRDLLYARHGLHGLLSAVRRPSLTPPNGPIFRYDLSPANADATENPEVDGGFTVRNQSAQMNCVQIEVAEPVREDETRRGLLVEDLATAIPNFVRRHAPF